MQSPWQVCGERWGEACDELDQVPRDPSPTPAPARASILRVQSPAPEATRDPKPAHRHGDLAGSTTGGSLSHNHSHTFVPTVDRQKHPPQCSHIQGFTLTCTLIRTHSEPYNPHVAPWNRPRGHHLTCTPSTPCPTTGMQAKDSRIHPAAHPGALELLDSLARQTGAFAPRHLHGLRAAARQPSRITPR